MYANIIITFDMYEEWDWRLVSARRVQVSRLAYYAAPEPE